MKLGQSLGFHARPHHAAFLVMPGMMDQAVDILRTLDLICIHQLDAEWGKLRDLVDLFSGRLLVQLIEDYARADDEIVTYDTPHLGISVGAVSAIEAATTLLALVEKADLGAGSRMDPADQTGKKIFVYIPMVLRFPIELCWIPEGLGI